MTLHKRELFFSVYVGGFFSRNKAVHVDYFDFTVCLDMPFFYFTTVSGHDVLQLLDTNGLTVSFGPWTLSSLPFVINVADQTSAAFETYTDGKD